MKKIAILGSTGSIGTQALDVIRKNPDRFKATVLSCGSSIELLKAQIDEFRPEMVVVNKEDDRRVLARAYPKIEVLMGMAGLIEAASAENSDTVLNSLVGMMGLSPTYHGIMAGKDIALANKETLVAGGDIIMKAVSEKGVKMMPVDSEHSAVFQCLEGNNHKEIKRIILTASGGPFRGFTKDQLENVTKEQALNHPKWKMGSKITIDSATLMNKGLEVIEAKWLFDVPTEKIDVIVHPESIIHSMVEYQDNSIMAQLGIPDMRIPISHAFSHPERLPNEMESVDFAALGSLTFEKPDKGVFQCLQMAYDALRAGGSAQVVLNAANEVLVDMFLQGKIKFIDIQKNIHTMMEEHQVQKGLGLDGIVEVDKETREKVLKRWG